ncbi:hypothetical protein [Ferranicluibacter rubi]|nr:hypothetical protein [Ferranicluibacter rubi]
MSDADLKTAEFHPDRGMYLVRIQRGSQAWWKWFGDKKSAEAF